MLGCLASLMLTMALAKRVDHAWKLVRRAAGHRQERGALERIFATSVGDRARALRGLVPPDRGTGAEPRAGQLSGSSGVGFRDYYRQFDDFDENELNRERRERRRREKQLALEQPARSRPVGHRVARPAALRDRERGDRARARAGQPLSGPPRRRRAAPARPSATDRPGADRDGQRRRRAAAVGRPLPARPRGRAGDALALVPALSAAGQPRGRAAAGVRPRRGARLGDRAHPRGRDLQPQRPDRPLRAGRRSSARYSPRCPTTSTCCSTRRLCTSRTPRTLDACLRLVDAFPRLLVVRTFSKAWGLSGLRAGYAVGSDAGPAGRGRAQPGRERADAGGGGARAADRRGRDRAPPRGGQPRARGA